MKKIILMLSAFGILIINAEARYYVQPQYPGSGGAPNAYCWDIAYVGSTQNSQGWEYTANSSSTSRNHGGQIFTAIEVFGYFDRTSADFNYSGMTLYYTQNLINNYNIIVGKRYYYKTNNSNITSGAIRAKHYSSV